MSQTHVQKNYNICLLRYYALQFEAKKNFSIQKTLIFLFSGLGTGEEIVSVLKCIDISIGTYALMK